MIDRLTFIQYVPPGNAIRLHGSPVMHPATASNANAIAEAAGFLNLKEEHQLAALAAPWGGHPKGAIVVHGPDRLSVQHEGGRDFREWFCNYNTADEAEEHAAALNECFNADLWHYYTGQAEPMPGENMGAMRGMFRNQRPGVGLVKVSWIRRQDVPAGQSAPGRLNCPCGHAPESWYKPGPEITCACGRVFDWQGNILRGIPEQAGA
jgi:hypothetical protein